MHNISNMYAAGMDHTLGSCGLPTDHHTVPRVAPPPLQLFPTAPPPPPKAFHAMCNPVVPDCPPFCDI